MIAVPAPLDNVRRHYAWADTFGPTQPRIAARPWMWEGDFRPHTQDFFKLQVCLSGSTTVRVGSTAHTLEPASVFLCRPDVLQAYEACRQFHAFLLAIDPPLLLGALDWTVDDPAIDALIWSGPVVRDGFRIVRIGDDTLARILPLLYRLHVAVEDPHNAHSALRLGLLTVILAEIGECIRDESPSDIHPAARTALRCLRDELAEHWTTERLAARVKLNPSYFIRIFRTATGMPPMAFLSRLRAERAAMLVAQSDLPIARIGQRVGLSDPAVFARTFRRHFALSAHAYRKRFRHAAPHPPAPHPPAPHSPATAAAPNAESGAGAD